MRFWIGVTAAFGAGAIIGAGFGVLMVEDKLKKEYAESTASMRRAMEAARIDAETPVSTEGELDTPLFLIKHDEDGVSLEGGAVAAAERYAGGGDEVDLVNGTGKVVGTVIDLPVKNPYHRPVSETSPMIYASYAELEEEDYYEEDGRVKEQITMVFDGGFARFFQNGEEIDDAFDRVGGTIVDDLRKAVGEGNPTVWVRNNQTDVDYEVLFEQP